MTSRITFERVACATSIGLAFVAACAGAAPEASARPTVALAPELPARQPADPEARRDGDKAADAGADAAPRCPYGSLEDPHRGFVRCLLPDERDAGWLPPPSQGDPPSAEVPRDAGPPAPASSPPAVEIGAPKFEGGDVTKVERSLGKASADLAKCVVDHGGLTADVATVQVQFLVRSRGRAEGVEVLAAKGVRAEAATCVRQTLRNRAIGAPTADPVGVTVTITFRPR